MVAPTLVATTPLHPAPVAAAARQIIQAGQNVAQAGWRRRTMAAVMVADYLDTLAEMHIPCRSHPAVRKEEV